MTFIKTTLLNAIAVAVKMLTLLGINKVLAVYVGPAGYAAIGQFQNAVQMIIAFASGAINTGVTKYTAEYHENEEKQRLIWRTAGTISLIGSVVSAILLISLNKLLAEWFLNDRSYGGVFVWFGATLIFFTFNAFLLAILNGKKDIVRYVIANISGSILSLIVTAIMAIKLELYGALIALAIYQSLSFITTFILCYQASWFRITYLFGVINKEVALKLLKYTAMALTSAACVPVSHIVVRNYLGESLGWDSAGYWEAMWRFSAAYLMLITTTFSVYYLPRLSELKDTDLIKAEIIQIYRFVSPLVVMMGITIYLCRDVIIEILFSTDFSPMRVLFGWQVLGDTLKIGSWMLAYLMLGKAMYKLFIFSEVVFAASFVCMTYFFAQNFGLVGVSIAHAANYGLYWLFMYYAVWKRLASI